MSKQIQLPSPGRIVDFTWGGGSGPAIVLSTNGSKVTLIVFSEANGPIKRENCEYSEDKAEHTWCYPEKVNGTFEYGAKEPVKEDTTNAGSLSAGEGKANSADNAKDEKQPAGVDDGKKPTAKKTEKDSKEK